MRLTNKHLVFFSLFAVLCCVAEAQDKPFNSPPLSQPAAASNDTNNPILSFQAQMLANELEGMTRDVRKRDKEIIARFGLQRIHRRYHILATIDLSPEATDADLEKYQILVNSRTGNLITASIPTRKYLAFVQSGLAKFIDISIPQTIHPL